jgi:DNA-binding CsgD family transcriptional regulator
VIVGRESEIDVVQRFVAAIPSGSSALLLEGSAGIGKTTLWFEAAALARRAGCRVMTTRASEAEARWSYSGLGDLLADVTEPPTDLPEAQRRALETALLRAETRGPPADQRAVSLAVLGVVRSLAASSPVVIGIDDVQWLDASTARVLSYAIRRLVSEPVAVIVSLRVGLGTPADPIDLERAIPSLHRVHVGPMAEDPLGRVVRERVDAELPHPVLVRVHEVSRGNPLFALEIARAVARTGARPEPGAPLPVPDDLQQLLSARLAALPSKARVPLLAVASASQATTDVVLAAASGSGTDGREGLAAAEMAGVIERSDGRIRFTHPLLGSTVYLNASIDERRTMHERLARIIDDPEEQARHLALSAHRPDTDVAQALEDAAGFARGRGAPDAAADLAELARELTPSDDPASSRRRSLAAAEYHFDAGDAARALAVLREAIAREAAGPARAELLFRLSSMSWMDLIEGVRAPAEQALHEAAEDRELRSGAEVTLAWVAFYLGDLDEAETQARSAMEDAATIADPGIRSDALATLGFVEFVRGAPSDRMAEAIALQDRMMVDGSWTEASVYTTPRSIFGLQLMWAGRLDDAREIFLHELDEYERHAMYTVRQEVLCYLAELECRAGRYGLGLELASEAMEIVVESGQTASQSHVVLFNQAHAAAYLGRIDDARSWASEGHRLALENDDAFNASWNHAVLGCVDVAVGDMELAHEHLAPVVEYLRRMGSAEPAIIPCVPDEIEALVALGRTDEAEPLVEALERQGRSLERPWARACAWRGRAQVAAARRDLDGAEAALRNALREHAETSQPFDHARSLLVLGQIERRRKQKHAARESFERAREIFAQLGTPLWIARADAEVGRIGGRPPAPLGLTPAERSVAELVSKGRTNREVADALFISPSTVQAHLKRIFRKLGVRSRTELAAHIEDSPTNGPVDQTYPRG